MKDFMTPPKDAVMAQTGPVWLDKDGIIITVNTSDKHDLEEAQANMVVTRKIGGGMPRPLLVDITKVKSMSKAAREEYVNAQSKEIITAVALITHSNVGRMVGNLFIGFNKHVVPVKLFNDAQKAKEWLLEYR